MRLGGDARFRADVVQPQSPILAPKNGVQIML
jgi:hypothetical protein